MAVVLTLCLAATPMLVVSTAKHAHTSARNKSSTVSRTAPRQLANLSYHFALPPYINPKTKNVFHQIAQVTYRAAGNDRQNLILLYF